MIASAVESPRYSSSNAIRISSASFGLSCSSELLRAAQRLV